MSGLISQGNRSVLLPTRKWSEYRRVMHQLLSVTAMARYMEYQNEEGVLHGDLFGSEESEAGNIIRHKSLARSHGFPCSGGRL